MKLKSNKFRRNDPCPCKSGKKLKRCCLGKVRALQDATAAGIPPHVIIVDRIFTPEVAVTEVNTLEI